MVGGIGFAALSLPPVKGSDRVTLEVVPNALVLRILARGQIDFVADLFWVRMGNMAGRATTVNESAALIPIANLIADLAPNFKYPYFVGGIMAPVRRGRSDVYDNVPEAVALMARGLKAVPTYGRLYLSKAYTELVMQHDPGAAGRTLAVMASQPDAPPYIGPLVTRLLAQGRNFNGAREFAGTLAKSEDPQVKADAEARLKQIDLEELLVQVDAASEKFMALEGRAPTGVEELVQKRLLPQTPVDPLGGEIELSAEGARSTANHDRLRVFNSLE